MKETAATAVNPSPALTGSVCIVIGGSGSVRFSWRPRLLFTFSAATWLGFRTATGVPKLRENDRQMRVVEVPGATVSPAVIKQI
jgi:hypothetical protein